MINQIEINGTKIPLVEVPDYANSTKINVSDLSQKSSADGNWKFLTSGKFDQDYLVLIQFSGDNSNHSMVEIGETHNNGDQLLDSRVCTSSAFTWNYMSVKIHKGNGFILGYGTYSNFKLPANLNISKVPFKGNV